ncbi:MAG: ABC transporter ATP-binding protein/permease [Lactobacillus sp.]|jgi:ATP-binding cassette subfamily B protein|nr:ABC transporter ATP-binding protein/permease [Lactobacillus sp.]
MQNNVFKFLWKYLSSLKGLFFATLFLRLIAECCIQLGIFYSSRIVGVISTQEGDKSTLFQEALTFALLFALFTLLRGFIMHIGTFLEAGYRPLFMVKVSKALFAQAHRHSMQFFSEEMSGRVATKVRQTVRETSDFYDNSYGLTNSLVKITIAFFFISKVNLLLTLFLFIFFLLYSAFLYLSSKGLIRYSEASHDTYTHANGVLVDTMFNYTLIRNYCRIFFEKLHYFKKVHAWVNTEKSLYIKEANMYITQGVIRAVLQMFFLLIPFYYWLNDEISVADFVLVESLTAYITLYCMDIGGSAARGFRNWGGIKDGLDFLYRPIHVVDKQGAKKLSIRRANIRFENISFGYKNSYEQTDKNAQPTISRLLFHHFNLDIKAGEKIGLVGRSGSGKSSLIKILSRYYDISDGKIMINSTNIADVTQDSLRQHISTIPQDPSLFNRSIMENIRYGRKSATDKEVIAAAKKAYIHDLIMSLPNGYNSKVGERGITLSGGERQRIAIARAIVKNAPILILDEATSALDSESELYIQKALQDVMEGKTVIAIAHRLSTLREMDRILVLDKGRIVEEGTHTGLYRKKGSYYDFYQLQSKNYRR